VSTSAPWPICRRAGILAKQGSEMGVVISVACGVSAVLRGETSVLRTMAGVCEGTAVGDGVMGMLVVVFGSVAVSDVVSVPRMGVSDCDATGPGIRNGKIRKSITFISPCAMETPSIDPLRFTMYPKNNPTNKTNMKSSMDWLLR